MCTLFNLFRNVMNYHNLQECRLQVSLVSVIFCLQHFEIHFALELSRMIVFARKQCILCSALRRKKLPYTTSCYIALRFILPWNFCARLYYAATSQPCVFVRLLIGNQADLKLLQCNKC